APATSLRKASTLSEIAPGTGDAQRYYWLPEKPAGAALPTRADLVVLTAPGRCSFVKRRRFTKHLSAIHQHA
ncbi:MAG: hypothetical protein WD625_11495, partial [Balneolales bacterium]